MVFDIHFHCCQRQQISLKIYSRYCHKLVSYTSAQGGLIINTASAAGIIFGDQDPALVGFDILYPDYLQCDSHRNVFELSKSQSR